MNRFRSNRDAAGNPWFTRPICFGALGVLFAVLAAFPTRAQEPPDSKDIAKAEATLGSLAMRIGNLESALGVARDSVGGIVAEARYFSTERRLLDADLFFETESYDRAATFYRDLVDNPGFKGKPGYYKALFKLGESLYQLRNFITARRYYRQSATPASGPNFGRSVARLFEIAVRTRDFADCEKYASLVNRGGVASPDVLYAYGKYLYHRDRRDEANAVFTRVAAGSPYYARARYFKGVLATTSGQLKQALTLFQEAVDQEPVTDKDRDVQGLALLAKSRAYFHLALYQDALAVIQLVDTASSIYPQSLFDTAWVYLKLEDLPSAVHALDLLMMTSVSGGLAMKGGALRGRLLTRMDDTEAASEAYDEVSASLGPVAAELERISSNPVELAAYFDWIIKRDSATFQMDVPVSEGTANWLQEHPDMAAIVGMFGDLSAEKEDVRKSLETADRLLWTLRTGGELITFPTLKEKVLRLKDVEGQFLSGAVIAADTAARLVLGRLPGDAGTRYEAAVRSRVFAGRGFLQGPQSYEEYLKREKTASSSFREVDKDLFLVESFLDVERQQVVAIEEWLLDSKVRGDEQLTLEREARVRANLDEEKKLLASLHHELMRLKKALDKETLSAESQTEMLRTDDQIRAEHLRALDDEMTALRGASTGLEGTLGVVMANATGLVDRCVRNARAVEPLVKNVLKVAKRGAAEFEKAVVREKHRLEEAVSVLKEAELDSLTFARNQGVEVFRAVRDRLKDVLLEADLGLVDMAWQREQKVSEKLRKLGKDRAEKVRSLGRMEKMLRDAVKAAEAQEKAAAGDQGGQGGDGEAGSDGTE